jgi:hypothetical protein
MARTLPFPPSSSSSLPPLLSFLSSMELTRLQDWCAVKAWDDGDMVSSACSSNRSDRLGIPGIKRHAARRKRRHKRKLADRRKEAEGEGPGRRGGSHGSHRHRHRHRPGPGQRRRRSASMTTTSPWTPPARTSASRTGSTAGPEVLGLGPATGRIRRPGPLHRRRRLRPAEDDGRHRVVLAGTYLRAAADFLIGQCFHPSSS